MDIMSDVTDLQISLELRHLKNTKFQLELQLSQECVLMKTYLGTPMTCGHPPKLA